MLLEYEEVAKHLRAAGVPVAQERLAANAEDAVVAAAAIPGAVAMKLVTPHIVHKADVGAVVLDVDTDEAARDAAGRLEGVAAAHGLAAGQWHVLVQQMARTTRPEVFIGLKRDDTFGPIIVLGAGGGLVELLPERAIAACPLSVAEAHEILSATTIGRALGAFRGQEDVTAQVAEVIAAASRLPELVPGLSEADLNPLVITAQGPLVVDARIAVDDEAAPAAAAPPREVPDLTPLLEPRSLLVAGASASGVVQPGNRILRYLRQHGYPGRVTVVHPTAAEVDGYPAVASVSGIPHGSIDLACLVVPGAACAQMLEECGAAGIPAALVVSSGFAEVGNHEGEAELAAIARRHGIALCGPNTVGLMSPGSGAYVSFSQALSMTAIPQGRVALIVQSGALGGSLASQAWERGIGISHFISVGNQAVLTIGDYVEHLATADGTDAIAVVVEGVADGRALLAAVERARANGKTVLVLKVGRTADGARAVQSHTGSVAGDDAVYRALLKRAGAVSVDTITELLDALAQSDAATVLRPGDRLGIVSTSGGACSMLADVASASGLRVPVFSDALQARVGEVLPGYAAVANPVDVTGRVTADPSIYGETLRLILESDEVDAVAVLVTTVADPMAVDIATQILDRAQASSKPLLVSWTIAAELAPEGLGLLRAAGIPVFDDPARMIAAARLASGE